jgi:hypothetical protein
MPGQKESRLPAPDPTPKISVDDQQVIDLIGELRTWAPADVDQVLQLAKWSLESVTHLTEYEDEKANRILTAIAFLSALVGVAFAAIAQRYPFATLNTAGPRVGWCLLTTIYCLFAVYFLLLTIGAALTLWAVRPRFRIPGVWKHTKKDPASFLFFQEILKVSGKDWASAFTQSSREKLQLEYAKNSILETYLIAQKIPQKLRPLNKGVLLFFASTVVLIFLLPLCAVTVVVVEVSPPAPAGVSSAENSKALSPPQVASPAMGGASSRTPPQSEPLSKKGRAQPQKAKPNEQPTH